MTPDLTEQKLSLLQKVLNEKLLDACEDGDYYKAREALEQGADINCRNREGWTPLHLATAFFHYDILVLLADNKAHISSKTLTGETALCIAYEDKTRGSTMIINLLKYYGAEECHPIQSN